MRETPLPPCLGSSAPVRRLTSLESKAACLPRDISPHSHRTHDAARSPRVSKPRAHYFQAQTLRSRAPPPPAPLKSSSRIRPQGLEPEQAPPANAPSSCPPTIRASPALRT